MGGGGMILCCGEALIDMLPMQGANGQAGFQPATGGAVFNTAVALGRLEARVGYFGGLSEDMFGDMIRADLDGAGVDHALSPVSARPTTLAFVRLVDGQASYVFYDENSATRMLDEADLPSLPEDAKALFFGGISLVSEPCGAAFERLARRESGRRLIMLDPNIRPGFITDEPAYRARLTAMIALADIVKISYEDLAWLSGDGSLEAARALLGQGPALVCLTRGGEGAEAFTAQGQAHASAQKVAIADTVGAGDTFNAALLARLDALGALSGREALSRLSLADIRDVLAYANTAAAITVSRPGADPPWAHELGVGELYPG